MSDKTCIQISRETWRKINQVREAGETMEEALKRAFKIQPVPTQTHQAPS